MAKEYIEREAALNKFSDLLPIGCSIRQSIAEIPAADVVEVIQCKECEHGKPVDGIKQPPYKYYRPECIICECEDVVGEDPMVYPPTHFCSYGKRKGE